MHLLVPTRRSFVCAQESTDLLAGNAQYLVPHSLSSVYVRFGNGLGRAILAAANRPCPHCIVTLVVRVEYSAYIVWPRPWTGYLASQRRGHMYVAVRRQSGPTAICLVEKARIIFYARLHSSCESGNWPWGMAGDPRHALRRHLTISRLQGCHESKSVIPTPLIKHAAALVDAARSCATTAAPASTQARNPVQS